MIKQDYRDFDCIKQLGEYEESFLKVLNAYADDLNDKIVIDGSVYTMHDFNNHCTDIYKIISEVLLEPSRAYDENGLTKKEIYILDLAVLFHDISMSRDIMTERKNHSQKSADYVQELYDNTESVLYKESGLNTNEIRALKAIIKAHSDVKDGSVLPENWGLKDPVLSDKMRARSGSIRAKLLAGILRMADELDVTNDRLGNTNIEKNLKKAKQKFSEIEMQKESGEGNISQGEYEKYKKYVESLEHWEKLHLFAQILREDQDDIVYLVTDDEYIQHLLDEGNSSAEIARKIQKSYNKIEEEWKKTKAIVIDDSKQKLNIKSIFPVSSIEVRCTISGIQTELGKLKRIGNMTDTHENEVTKTSGNDSKKEKKQNKEDEKNLEVKLIDENLSERLTNEVNRRHLLKVGHFLLDDIYCARDWIDTKDIIETRKIVDKIVGSFIEKIKSLCDMEKKYLLVGLDSEGALLASRIAIGLKMPFSYIIPARNQNVFSIKESEISIQDYEGVILITDVVVTFDTIKKVLDEIMRNNSIKKKDMFAKEIQIYTVFYRESKMHEINGVEELKERTFCANKGFSVELFLKENCQYIKEGKCLATNNRL